MRQVCRLWRASLFLAVCAGIASAQGPKPAPLARYFPRKDLVAYVEFDGIDAHSEAWKKTALARLLDETPTGTMLSDVASQILDAVLVPGEEGMPTPAEITTIAQDLFRSGFAFAINRKPDDPSAKPTCVGLVLRGAGRGPLAAMIKKILDAEEMGQLATTLDKPGGRKLTLVGPAEGPCVAWWAEKDDLVFSIMEAGYADVMISVLDGKEPNAVEHPARLELIKVENGLEPAGLAFLDATALPPLPPEGAMFGLDGIKRVDLKWGYQGEALVSISRIIAPSPRKGVLAMFDQPTFDGKSLPPLPDGVGTFTAFSIDLVKVFDQLAALAKVADPKGPDLFAQAAEAFQKETGRRLREDFLGRVGPKMVFADVPMQVFVTSNPFDGFAQALARVPRFSLLIELRDRANFLKDLEVVANWANAQFPIPKDPKAKGDKPAPSLIRKLKNVQDGYEVALSPTYWPLPAGYRPSIVVGEKYVAIGTSPDVAKQALRRDADLGAPLARAIASLPPDLTLLSVVDTRNTSLPEVLANVPSMIQWWGFMIQSAEVASPLGVALPIPGAAVPISGTVRIIETAPPTLAQPPPPEALGPPPGVDVASRRPRRAQAQPPEAFGLPPAGIESQPGPLRVATTSRVATLPPPEAVIAAPAPAASVAPAPAPAALVAPASAPAVLVAPASAPAILVAPAPAVASRPVLVPAQVQIPAPAPPQVVPRLLADPPPVTPPAPQEIVVGGASPLLALASMKFRLRLDPDDVPSPSEIRPFLFPATYSLSADATGFRITTRESFPSWNPISLAPIAVAAALPAFQEWRETNEKERLSANLRQIGIGLNQYLSTEGHFPAAATLGKDGKPLLSWRVEILPSLGLQSLYKEFHRDEPWDSPHNKTLIEKMPPVFAHPDGSDKPGMTPYRGLIGKSAFFDPEEKEGVTIAMITDGTSNTVALVEAKEAVPWTKPGTEIQVVGPANADARTAALLALLGGRKAGGFQILLVDGSVRFLSDSINVNTLQSITTRDGGEVVSSDSF
jgi:Protein of unknown function (DUF1559)